jgi:hypothetical protein
MYTAVLVFHSWLRWVVLATGIMAVVSLRGSGTPARDAAAERWSLIFMMTLDVQMLLGLLLYLALSPQTQAILNNFSASMRDPVARFWAIEHVSAMLFAVVIVHVGRVLGRKARTADARRGRMMLCFVAALVAILGGTPWPGMPAGRPLFRISQGSGIGDRGIKDQDRGSGAGCFAVQAREVETLRRRDVASGHARA